MLEGLFGKAKSQAKAKDATSARSTIESIKLNVARDALELDGVIADDLPEDQKEAAAQKLLDQRTTTTVTPEARRVYSFVTAFTILLREGLEALLVVAAIVLYLVRSGNRRLTKYVYWGVLAGIGVSILLAVLLGAVLQNAGAGQEMLEGGTMFLAVLVLFYISNWMLSKSDEQAWERYVRGKVDQSITTGSMWLLSFAAFLAVSREGAELVLFYAAAFQGGMADSFWVGIGIAAAAALLLGVFVVFRYFAVKLPIGIVFKATSALLFLLAIVFVGNGVVELGEAGFVLGQTSIPSLSWLTIPVLGLYPRAETLLPQLILVVAAIWLTVAQNRDLRRQKHESAEAEAEAMLLATEPTD
nr:FTR1 family protein [Pseudoclavibacter sp. 13-3]